MAISKSIELFVDTYCHTMLGDREAFLSHGRISRNNFLVNLVDITTDLTVQAFRWRDIWWPLKELWSAQTGSMHPTGMLSFCQNEF